VITNRGITSAGNASSRERLNVGLVDVAVVVDERAAGRDGSCHNCGQGNDCYSSRDSGRKSNHGVNTIGEIVPT
jgi:hypothetical protein